MPNYMLLLHEEPMDYSQFSPEQIQEVTGEYVAWRNTIEAEGKYVGAEKLKDEGGRHLSGQNGSLRVTDGPYTEAKEVIGGYFTISAGNYDEAVKIAEDCPHLKYGGRIELREPNLHLRQCIPLGKMSFRNPLTICSGITPGRWFRFYAEYSGSTSSICSKTPCRMLWSRHLKK